MNFMLKYKVKRKIQKKIILKIDTIKILIVVKIVIIDRKFLSPETEVRRVI